MCERLFFELTQNYGSLYYFSVITNIENNHFDLFEFLF